MDIDQQWGTAMVNPVVQHPHHVDLHNPQYIILQLPYHLLGMATGMMGVKVGMEVILRVMDMDR